MEERDKLPVIIDTIEEATNKGLFWEDDRRVASLMETILFLCGIIRELIAEGEK